MNDEITISSGDAHTLGSSGKKWSQVYAVPSISFSVGSGNAAAPAYTFDNNTDTGFYWSGGDTIKVVAGRHVSSQDIYSLYASGKNMKDHTQEYIDAILWLPWVNGDQLRMVETFEYFRKQLFPESDEL